MTPFQQRVVDAFGGTDTEVDIVVLYHRIYGDPGEMDVRAIYQRLSPAFMRTNRALKKLGGLRIEPGAILKRTYKIATER